MDTITTDASFGSADPLCAPSVCSDIIRTAPPAFAHQTDTTNRILQTPAIFIASDAGTGKTRAVIDALKLRGERVLVLAPKSILFAAWAQDFDKFAPTMKYIVATNTNRKKAFESDAKVVITNHDAVKWILKNKSVLDDFDTLVVDESTAFKNFKADRSKALKALAGCFDYRMLLSGTPTPNSIMDLWHQMLILDDGERLGKSFFKFRNITQENKSVGIYPKWVDKEGVTDVIALLVSDITVRYKLEDCIDIPANHLYDVTFSMPNNLLTDYIELKRDRVLELPTNTVSVAQASTLIQKLLQVASGAVYGEYSYSVLDRSRYELILDLVEQREQCVVAFIWQHQRDLLVEEAKQRKISFGVIDSSASLDIRTQLVNDFQAGKIKVIFAHPQSAGHGLTLTRGTSTIWSSPTYNYEHYEQFNRRIYRATQTKKTETIHIVAPETVELQVYECLKRKQLNMAELLTVLKDAT